jgi:two-component system, NtrC family, sensor histidine kinase HydH
MEGEPKTTASFCTLVEKITTKSTSRWVVSASILLCAGFIDSLTEGSSAVIYAIPVVVAAVLEGWPGGLVVALLSSAGALAFSPHRMSIAKLLEPLALVLLAALTAATTGRERRLRHHYQQVAGQLSSVYGKVQANFEGMKRAERLSALGQLSAGLAHEVRNPLASISGAAAILQRNENLDPKHTKCIDIITKECNRLNGLLTNFIDFARPPAPHFQTINLDAVLDSVLALANHGIRGKMVHCEKHIPPNLPRPEGDPEQLEQVLLNLVINAIEASPNGETVVISAGTENGKIVLQVIDQGHGVPPAQIDRLFDPFFTTKEHGTGLGLPVAHQIMTQMGGALLAQRGAEKGMMFSVVLPAKHRDV